MSRNLLLFRTHTNTEELSAITSDTIAPWARPQVLAALQLMGRAEPQGRYLNIWLGEAACIEAYFSENEEGDVPRYTCALVENPSKSTPISSRYKTRWAAGIMMLPTSSSLNRMQVFDPVCLCKPHERKLQHGTTVLPRTGA